MFLQAQIMRIRILLGIILLINFSRYGSCLEDVATIVEEFQSQLKFQYVAIPSFDFYRRSEFTDNTTNIISSHLSNSLEFLFEIYQEVNLRGILSNFILSVPIELLQGGYLRTAITFCSDLAGRVETPFLQFFISTNN